MRQIKKFAATEKQEKAFDEVAKAIKKAKRAGLVFYGKNDSLVAYTKQANEYIEDDFLKSIDNNGGQIECITKLGLINDSGADDYGRYASKEDEEMYGGYK